MNKKAFSINLLHILNDGFKASLMLFLPFIAKEFHIGLTQVGILGTTANMLEVFLSLPAGILAVRYGGFRVLIFALFFYALGYALSAFAPAYYAIIPAFVIAGIGFALFHPIAFALVTKLYDKKERGKQLGHFTAIGDVGRIGISSIITFIITYVGWRYTALISFLFLFIILLFFLKTLVKADHNEKETEQKEDGVSYRNLLRNKKFILAMLSGMFDSLASSSLFVFIPFLLLRRNVSPEFLGVLTSTFFLGNMFGKVILGRLMDKFGNTTVFMVSELFMAIFIFLLSNSTFLPLVIVASIVLGVFTKGTIPVVVTMLSESVEHHGRFEKASSLNAAFVGIATTIAPTLLGFFADKWGIVMAFNLSAILAIMATIPAFLYKRQT